MIQRIFKDIRPSSCLASFLSSIFLAFGLYHVHSLSGVTEGGVLGLNLLLDHWFHISPAVTNLIANSICYLLGWRLLGKTFIIYSLFATAGFSVSYRIFEQFPPLWPQLYDMPLAAALIGAVFVGAGAGICVRHNAAVSVDDALAMSISHITHVKVQWVYLVTDFTVLALSATYIPLNRLIYSFITVFLSGQIIGLLQKKETKEEVCIS